MSKPRYETCPECGAGPLRLRTIPADVVRYFALWPKRRACAVCVDWWEDERKRVEACVRAA